MTEAPGANPQQDLHILTVLVENRFGVLSRIAGLFSRRGFNISQYGGSIVDSDGEELIVSLHAHPDQLDLCETALHKFGILELQRTGRIALGRLGG